MPPTGAPLGSRRSDADSCPAKRGLTCDFKGAAVEVKRKAIGEAKTAAKPGAAKAPKPTASRSPRARSNTEPSTSRKKLTKKERRRRKNEASAKAFIRRVQRGRGPDGEYSSSVRTVSGGIPTLGRR